MHELLPGRLYLGNAHDARNLQLLAEHEIQALVDLALNESPVQPFREMVYVRIPLVDGGGNAAALIESAIRSVVLLLQQNFRVLVACSAGMSRSPAIAAVALAMIARQSPEACLAEVVAGHPHDVSPALWATVREAHERIAADEA